MRPCQVIYISYTANERLSISKANKLAGSIQTIAMTTRNAAVSTADARNGIRLVKRRAGENVYKTKLCFILFYLLLNFDTFHANNVPKPFF